MCSGPHCVRRSSTTHGCSASTRWSRCRIWRRLWGARLRRVGCLRAPLLPVSALLLHKTRLRRLCCARVLVPQVPRWRQLGMWDSGVDSAKGTDPKTGFVPSGGEVKTDHKGTDPKTGFVPSGGEVKTDHVSLDAQMTCLVGEVDDSPLPGGLATQTATPDPPACTDFAISRAECPEEADGFSTSNFPAVPDGFPSISKGCESRDELPRSGVSYSSSGIRIDELYFGQYKYCIFMGFSRW